MPRVSIAEFRPLPYAVNVLVTCMKLLTKMGRNMNAPFPSTQFVVIRTKSFLLTTGFILPLLSTLLFSSFSDFPYHSEKLFQTTVIVALKKYSFSFFLGLLFADLASSKHVIRYYQS